MPTLVMMGSSRELRARSVVACYVLGGLVAGVVWLQLIPIVRAMGLPRDAAVSICLFGLMPILIVALAWRSRRFPLSLLGVVACMATWALGYALACAISGYDSILFGLATMGSILAPVYVGLALIGCVLGRRISGRPS